MKGKGLHLSTFILALSFGGVLFVSALFAISSYFSTQKLIEREISQSFDYRHSILNLSLEERLNIAQSRLSSRVNHPELIEAIEGKNQKKVEEILFSLLQEEETKNLDILFLSGEGGVIIGDVSSPLSTLGGQKEKLLANAMDAFDNWILLGVGEGAEQSIALFLSIPVIEPELGRVVGGVHAAISLTENLRFTRELKEAANVSELIVSYGGRIHSNASGQKYPGLVDQFKDLDSPFISLGGDVAALLKTKFKTGDGTPLTLVTFLKGDASTSLSDLYARGAVYLLLAAVVTALVIAYIARHLISKSSDHLFSYVDNVLKGDRKASFEKGPVSEFNLLGNAVSEMVTTIHENERYLTNLIELANSPIVAWDGDGKITKFNRAAERLFARKSEDVEKVPVRKLMGMIGLSEEGERSILERSLGGSVIDNWEMVVTNPKTGQDHYLSWSISPVAFHNDNTVATVLAQGLDMTRRKLAEEELQRVNEELELRVMHRTRAMEDEISERRQIEQELRKSEERFRDIAESASDWFWEMGPDLRFTYMSDKAIISTGFQPGDIIGKTRMELVPTERMIAEGDKWREHSAMLQRHESFQGFEYHITNRDGEDRVFRISGKPIIDGKTGEFLGYRGAGRDVTKSHLQQEELHQAMEQAENASQAKSEFLSSMSHELRTPLNGILGFAQLLMMPNVSNLTDKQKEFASQIVKAGQHLLDLINEILDLAKIEARKVDVSLEAVAPSVVMHDVTELIKGLAEDYGITVQDDVAGRELPPVYADFTRLKQVLVNLGSNAVKYNSTDGVVTFDCRICTDENMVEFSVADTGQGIPPDEVEQLFQPFNRLGAEFSDVEGTGIGLTITHQLVELMDGKLGVESTVGSGSRFWVRMPLYEEQQQNENRTLVPSILQDEIETVVFDDEINLLYVEDNPNNRKLMEELLSGVENINLNTTRTAEEGIDLAYSHKPDLIFLDINLPGMSGWQMLEMLRSNEHTQHIPVVAVTAQAMMKDVEKGKEAGFDAYVAKPININNVFDVIRANTQKPAE